MASATALQSYVKSGERLEQKLFSFFDSEDLPDASTDGIEAVRSWAKERIQFGEASYISPRRERMESPVDWADSVCYHLQADRFNNGNLDNDMANLDLGQQWDMKVGDPSNIPVWRHGGDLKGIQDRLPYMAELGVNTLWVTPVLQHDGNYHAYCSTDPSTTDPGFGSPQELRDLVSEAHRYGIRFVLDIVVNHLCDPDTHYEKVPDHIACPRKMNETHWLSGGTAENEDQGTLAFGPNFFKPFRLQEFFTRCGPCEYEEMSSEGPGSIYGDFRDGMFDYDTRNQDWQEIFTDLMKFWVAYADIDAYRLDAAKHVTEDFIAYFSTQMRSYARSLGKNNFMVLGEVATLQAEWQAARLGRMMSDPVDPTSHGAVPVTLTARLQDLKEEYLLHPAFPLPGLNAVYNFAESGTGRDAILGWRTGAEIASYFGSYKYNLLVAQLQVQGAGDADASGNTWDGKPLSDDVSTLHGQLWTALELHDWPRILAEFPKQAMTSILSLTWLLMAPGAPVLYAGIEQGFNGNCPDEIHIDNASYTEGVRKYCTVGFQFMRYDAPKRQDMFISGPWRLGSAIDEVDRLAYVGEWHRYPSPHWSKDPFLARDHELYLTTRNLVHLRRSCRVLSHGTMRFHEYEDVKHPFLAFSRILAPTKNRHGSEMVVAINAGNASFVLRRLEVDAAVNPSAGLKYVNVFNVSQEAVVELSEGKAYLHFVGQGIDGLTVEAYSMAVFAQVDDLRKPLQSDEGSGVALCKSAWKPNAAPGDDAALLHFLRL
eukprot:CAMPEP_0178442244 /NCGR_PEP_ID=MMETSP0689_2-20121128/38033_1 /TAXON_ID=160604 /ORGANISM="Amphidinium massartii, Strain CS-259" /LENGTH=767 /DNA_ID=CAMNT_0020065721 /DNA_START=41 /DNA_END=2342 /DNA_ORIENTATION=+